MRQAASPRTWLRRMPRIGQPMALSCELSSRSLARNGESESLRPPPKSCGKVARPASIFHRPLSGLQVRPSSASPPGSGAFCTTNRGPSTWSPAICVVAPPGWSAGLGPITPDTPVAGIDQAEKESGVVLVRAPGHRPGAGSASHHRRRRADPRLSSGRAPAALPVAPWKPSRRAATIGLTRDQPGPGSARGAPHPSSPGASSGSRRRSGGHSTWAGPRR
jgi:hypothetical protein